MEERCATRSGTSENEGRELKNCRDYDEDEGRNIEVFREES